MNFCPLNIPLFLICCILAQILHDIYIAIWYMINYSWPINSPCLIVLVVITIIYQARIFCLEAKAKFLHLHSRWFIVSTHIRSNYLSKQTKRLSSNSIASHLIMNICWFLLSPIWTLLVMFNSFKLVVKNISCIYTTIKILSQLL